MTESRYLFRPKGRTRMKKNVIALAVAAAIAPSALLAGDDIDPKDYSVVDANGDYLGDVFYIESACSVWADVEIFGAVRTINVLLDERRTGRKATKGQTTCTYVDAYFDRDPGLRSQQVFYDGANCTGNAYLDTRFLRGSTPPLIPGLRDRDGEITYWQSSDGTQWQEILVDYSPDDPLTSTTVYSYKSRLDGGCTNLTSQSRPTTPIVSFGPLEDKPPEPIRLENKKSK